MDVLYTMLNRLWCKARGEVEPFDHFDETWVCIGLEEGGADERRRRASTTPRAVLRLSSWWSPCSGQEVRSGNDSSVVWMRCETRCRGIPVVCVVGRFIVSHQCDESLDYLLDRGVILQPENKRTTGFGFVWLCVDLGEFV